MDTAIAFNTVTKKQKTISAAAFEKELAVNPGYANDLKFFEPKTKLSVPVYFRRSRRVKGDSQEIAAHFARAAGYGPKDHVLPREKISKAEAVRRGQAILLSLNLKLTPRDFDFSGMQGEHIQTRQEFREKMEGKYISLSARSVEEVAKRLAIVEPKKRYGRVFILYQGAVLPYDRFFVAPRDTARLYHELESMKGSAPKGEARIVGLPRLAHFVPTKTMIDENGANGLKGNAVRARHVTVFNQLFVDDWKTNPAYGELKKYILRKNEKQQYAGVYVLACPTITAGKKSEVMSPWRQVRWIINDIGSQTMPVAPLNDRERPKHNAETEAQGRPSIQPV